MDKVQKHNSFNTNTPSSESYKNYLMTGQLHAPNEMPTTRGVPITKYTLIEINTR
jgi:hypothetical protein